MNATKKRFSYSVAASVEKMARKTPFMLQGDLRQSVSILQNNGFDAVELQIRNPLDFRRNEDWFFAHCEKTGFAVSAVGTGSEFVLNRLSLTSPDSSVRADAIQRMKEHIDLAAVFETNVVVGTVRGNLSEGQSAEQYQDSLHGALTVLCDYALPKKVTLVLEAINFYVMDFFTSVGETSDFVDRVNAPNLKVHIDTHHMAIEEIDMFKSIKDCGGRVGYVHFCENNRLYPGGSGIDFAGAMLSLDKIGYNGYISLECFPLPSGEESCRLAMENLMRFEQECAFV